MTDLTFYNNKKVFITGHTGFKGSWLCFILCMLGAEVTGYALEPQEPTNLFELVRISNRVKSIIGDIRDRELLTESLLESKAEIVFHLAAQPLVRESYREPAYTYEVNVMGTVNILEAIRNADSVHSFLNVTTDKVYENTEKAKAYVESDRIDGYDPYSNSKSCSELVTATYRRSFFSVGSPEKQRIAISTARAGNVIGGGDFAEDRIIPDCSRAALGWTDENTVLLRNPKSIRPYQHVLEPLFAYLEIAARQYQDRNYEGAYNIGPLEKDCITTEELVKLFCENWRGKLKWESLGNPEQVEKAPHEANILKLDALKIRERLGYMPRWNIEKAIQKTVEWIECYADKGDLEACMERQVREFLSIK